jgi:hypothetical protein
MSRAASPRIAAHDGEAGERCGAATMVSGYPADVPATQLNLRIVVVAPPPNVTFCIGSKRGGFPGQVRSTGHDLMFEVVARVKEGRLLGDEIQGPPTARFVYVASGTLAGDAASCWTRRAKVPLSGITPAMMAKGGTLVAKIAGVAKDGGPACASVPLLGGKWVAASA